MIWAIIKNRIEIDIKTYCKGCKDGVGKVIGTHMDEVENYDENIANEIRRILV